MMSIKLCRTFVPRNLTNTINITNAEWLTNSISLIIFSLAFLGNTAALIVMFGSRGPIRLTNNKYLANLACADLLRACFIPFTIIARMKRNFIFGKIICRILPIVQSLSVAVDVVTLVCISIERYLAICRPLLILKLQSIHCSQLLNAFILIGIWSFGLLIALPNFYLYNLCSLPTPGRFKCEKIAVQEFDERYYMIVLDAFYFMIPMAVMIVLYTLIIWKMYRNSTATKMRSVPQSAPKIRSVSSTPPLTKSNSPKQHNRSSTFDKLVQKSSQRSSTRSRSGHSDDLEQRQQSNTLIPRINVKKTNSENSCASSSQGLSRVDRQRRKALKLLITLIVEFFVCWTPLYIYHTIGTFDKQFYRRVPPIFVDLILLFSFASASCNPLTYYFMSQRYRSVLYAYLPCVLFDKNHRFCQNRKERLRKTSMKINRQQLPQLRARRTY